MIEDILKYNKQFVENKGYEKYITNKYPDKKIKKFVYGSDVCGTFWVESGL